MSKQRLYNLGFQSVHTGRVMWAEGLSGEMVQWTAPVARKECVLQRKIFKDKGLINTRVITRLVKG